MVDGMEAHILRGWAWFPSHPAQSALIEISSGDEVLAHVEASLFRGDLAQADKREGYCAFAVPLNPRPPDGTLLTITARRGDGQPHELPGSPHRLADSSHAGSLAEHVDVLPLPIVAPGITGFLDQCGPAQVRGWAYRLHDHRSLSFSLCEADVELVRIEANRWRPDIAELRQGDGCCGFEVPLPPGLRDGQVHLLELRLHDTGESALAAPFRVQITPSRTGLAGVSRPIPLERTASGTSITLSVIVNFYNMQREAARTLASLSRDYQQGADDFDYEVLCIDNGSDPPLDPDWVAGFGPQFRLLRPSNQLASPCVAINEAALQARGRYLAVMIDGAHVLTPGVFQEARLAWQQDADAVVALRHWFVGGDQRWLAMVGYSRAMEDQLFQRIRWPANGYELFRIGAPIGENPEPWFDGLAESNCLMLPTALYDNIGGYDPAFDEPGGGFANLDLFRRAVDAASGPLISLVGEASFHQFHGGTTTNVADAEKDSRVRTYANAYRALRGEEFTGVHRSGLSFRGRMPSEFATGVRQRSLLPMRLSITEQVRPGQLALHWDEGAQTYLQSVYAECSLQQDVRWLGLPTGVAPADLISLQGIIHHLSPDAIIAIGAEAGLIGFIDAVLHAINSAGARLLCISPAMDRHAALPPRATRLDGPPGAPHIVATARHWTGTAETVLVLHAVGPDEFFSASSLRAYGELVSYRSYLVCLGTLFGQPWLGYSSRQYMQTIREFADEDSPFMIDRSWNQQLISTCPSGYLRKVGGATTHLDYNAALDEALPSQLASLENIR